MLKLLPSVFLSLASWGIFIYVITQGVPYPQTLTQASPLQLLAFLTPLFFALTFTINIAAKFLLISIFISLGIIIILLLKALDALNFVTIILTTITVYLFVSYFRRKEALPHLKKPKNRLTSPSNVPKLRNLIRRRR